MAKLISILNTILLDDKIQILAHLANFAYDPINYEHLIKLNVTELFLDCLDEDNAQLVEFAAAGLCNMILGRSDG